MNKSSAGVLEKVSFVMTVYNESESIGPFLDSLFCQDSMPSEIIITDGGSSDGTCQAVAGYFEKLCRTYSYFNAVEKGGKIFEGVTDKGIRLLLIVARGSKISEGRNISIKNATKDFICISDGGCTLGKNWCSEITRDFFSEPALGVTGGYSFGYADSFFKACLAICILPRKSEIKKNGFMPSSRNIGFTKEAWQRAGGYPENMDFGEDMKFNFNLISCGFQIKFNPGAEVYWNLRNSPVSVFRQFFRYAKGDAIGRMYAHRHIIRFASFLLFAAVLAAAVIFSPYFLLLLAALMIAYCHKPYFRINYFLMNKKACPFIVDKNQLLSCRLRAVFLIPLMLIYIDIAKLSGYIYGLAVRDSKKA
ncbi:MAG: glycosyltransferase [Actinobacteria bacterium]|nr:glycosyltransferase [Actinomycetota bacterium]